MAMGAVFEPVLKVCRSCKLELDICEFGIRKDRRRGGWVARARCRKCERIFAYAARRHPDKPTTAAGNSRRHEERVASNVPGERIDTTGVVRKHGRWCYLCESNIEQGEMLCLDHVVPLSAGGQHHPSNLRPVHRDCNSRKSWKLLHELDLPFESPRSIREQVAAQFAAQTQAHRDRMLFERID